MKYQKVTLTTHTGCINLTLQAKAPGESADKVCKDEEDSLVRSNSQACLEVKPSDELACEACLAMANNPRVIMSACKLHLILDLASLLEARLTDTNENFVLDYMHKRDYRAHAKTRMVK